MYLYLWPIEKQDYKRAPRYLRSRINPSGLNYAWSLKDFGSVSEIGLVATDQVIKAPDALRIPVTWSQLDRDRVGGVLRSAGIESQWVEQAADWRDAWQRLAGLTQVYQSAGDDPFTSMQLQDPSVWLGRFIHFGFGTLQPLDRQAYAREQEAKRWRIGDWALYGREWVHQITGRVVPMVAGGALPYTDAFTVGSDTSLVSYSNWGINQGAMTVLAATDDVRGNSAGAESAGRNTSETYANNQYAQLYINNLSGSGYIGPATRLNTSGTSSYYGWYPGVPDEYLFKHVTGSWTQLGSLGGAGQSSVIYRLESNGTTHTPLQNGATSSPPGAQTDSSHSAGAAGVCGYSNENSRGDNFEGGDLGGGATGQPTMRRWANVPGMRIGR